MQTNTRGRKQLVGYYVHFPSTSVITAVEGYVAGDKNNEGGKKYQLFKFCLARKAALQKKKKKKLPAETNVFFKKSAARAKIRNNRHCLITLEESRQQQECNLFLSV